MMRELKLRKIGSACLALLVVALAALVLAGSASAELTGAFTRFKFCPWKTAGVERCAISVTEGGEVVLGKKTVPIVNPVTLQGGYGELTEEEEEEGVKFVPFVGATNGVTLSHSPQPVPGGLLGLVPPESSPPLIKALVELAAKNGLTGVESTLELVGPPSEIEISESHLAEGLGVALVLPLKAHLENPFLGKSCYVGSSTAPIVWELTAGKTSPPGPNESIKGKTGSTHFLEKGQIVELTENELVDNAWAAPEANGCGEALSLLVDPIVNATAGLPSAAGNNTAILKSTVSETTSFAVNKNDKEHP
jgi:hypothetical protein